MRQTVDRTPAREGYAAVRDGNLFYRDIGHGRPAIVLHGGPDFDHRYLLPELDRLAGVFRLVYFDQRGRGWSEPDVAPEAVTIASEVADIEGLREHFGLERVALLGHSWGGVLALEYATRHPERVSHLLLMNSAPVSHGDAESFRQEFGRRTQADMATKQEIAATPRYQEGDPDADAEYYRAHFRAALHRPELVDVVVARLRLGFTPAGILKARVIEDRLYDETWRRADYDLLTPIARLDVPALVLHGDRDIIPIPCAEHIARAIPGARFAAIRDCGHFAYLERPAEVLEAMAEFIG